MLELVDADGSEGCHDSATGTFLRHFFGGTAECHPPQLKPMTMVMTAPTAAPCSKRLSDWPCRIEGTCIGCFLSLARGTRAIAARGHGAAEAGRIRAQRSSILECYCCLPMAPALPIRKERRLRCVAVLWAELREAGLSVRYGQTQPSLQEGRRMDARRRKQTCSRGRP